MRWPFLHDRFANNDRRIHENKVAVGFTSSATNRPSMGVDNQLLCVSYREILREVAGDRPIIEGAWQWPSRNRLRAKNDEHHKPSQSLSLANTVLFHHLQEIEEYRAAPPYLRNKYDHSSACYVESHNLSHAHGRQYSANFKGELPRFWESWQGEALKLPSLSHSSASDWMRVIWDLKILPEYLQRPAKKPHNPSISRQVDLTILGATQALARYQKQAKTVEEFRRHEARIAAGEEDEGSMEGDIKQALQMALNRHAQFRDKHMPEAVLFSW